MSQRLSDDLTNETVQQRLDGQYTAGNFTVNVTVSPCSWMYAGYGLQIEYRDTDGSSWGFCNRKELDCQDATKEDVQALLDALVEGKCSKCERPHILWASGNRGDKCETCFVEDLLAESAAERAKEEALAAPADAFRKAEGYTHKTVAWVHPSGGGDDYQIVMYTDKRPTKAEVQAQLKKKRSSITTDYTITKL